MLIVAGQLRWKKPTMLFNKAPFSRASPIYSRQTIGEQARFAGSTAFLGTYLTCLE
jgi:hypothetical protein